MSAYGLAILQQITMERKKNCSGTQMSRGELIHVKTGSTMTSRNKGGRESSGTEVSLGSYAISMCVSGHQEYAHATLNKTNTLG